LRFGLAAPRFCAEDLFELRRDWVRRGSGFELRSSRTRSSETLGATRTGMASIVPAIALKLGGVIGAGISS